MLSFGHKAPIFEFIAWYCPSDHGFDLQALFASSQLSLDTIGYYLDSVRYKSTIYRHYPHSNSLSFNYHFRSVSKSSIRHCSPDALEWTRKQGIRVQYSQNGDTKPKERKTHFEWDMIWWGSRRNNITNGRNHQKCRVKGVVCQDWALSWTYDRLIFITAVMSRQISFLDGIKWPYRASRSARIPAKMSHGKGKQWTREGLVDDTTGYPSDIRQISGKYLDTIY
jgi:hypothetical protein